MDLGGVNRSSSRPTLAFSRLSHILTGNFAWAAPAAAGVSETQRLDNAVAPPSNLANTGHQHEGARMRKFTSAHAKNHFGELIDAARAEPVAITKYDRTVVVMVAAEEYERMKTRTRESKTRKSQKKALT